MSEGRLYTCRFCKGTIVNGVFDDCEDCLKLFKNLEKVTKEEYKGFTGDDSTSLTTHPEARKMPPFTHARFRINSFAESELPRDKVIAVINWIDEIRPGLRDKLKLKSIEEIDAAEHLFIRYIHLYFIVCEKLSPQRIRTIGKEFK